ncbi:hypothetical protein [Actinomadura sp. NPDC048394]|jgi:hypothetical protein|uniref:hypothetical protein n=1 Tax=Actinomadura sp. NPDC048394 TaxID=3158223 RepID=UPI0033E8B66A
MSKYTLPPDVLSKIDYTYTTGAGEYTQVQTQHGLTQQEWNDLPEYEQRQLYYQYSPDAGKPTDPSNALPPGSPLDDKKWDIEAGKGYEVDPKELRDLASKMHSEFTGWQQRLGKVQKIAISTGNLGNTPDSQKFVDLASQSRDGFGQYIQDITKAYNGVIEKLKATADGYENAHHTTQKQVNSVNPGGGPNLT